MPLHFVHRFKHTEGGPKKGTALLLRLINPSLKTSEKGVGSLVALTDTMVASDKKTYKVFRIENVEVKPKYQGKGYGTALYHEAMRLIEPHWLSSDFIGGTTSSALRVWNSLFKDSGVECRKVISKESPSPFRICRLKVRGRKARMISYKGAVPRTQGDFRKYREATQMISYKGVRYSLASGSKYGDFFDYLAADLPMAKAVIKKPRDHEGPGQNRHQSLRPPGLSPTLQRE